jgi:hypothetical protein
MHLIAKTPTPLYYIYDRGFAYQAPSSFKRLKKLLLSEHLLFISRFSSTGPA